MGRGGGGERPAWLDPPLSGPHQSSLPEAAAVVATGPMAWPTEDPRFVVAVPISSIYAEAVAYGEYEEINQGSRGGRDGSATPVEPPPSSPAGFMARMIAAIFAMNVFAVVVFIEVLLR